MEILTVLIVDLVKRFRLPETIILIVGLGSSMLLHSKYGLVFQSSSSLWYMQTILILLTILSILISYILKSKPYLFSYRNVLLDKSNQIYCDHCRKLLSKWHFSHKKPEVNRSAWRCSKCKNEIYLTSSESGLYISLEEFIVEKNKDQDRSI